jgi:4-hydroxythreonine-4-phosphate dehydrogenase
MTSNLPLVAVTMGDPVGIGPEITSKALCDPRISACCRPVVYGDVDRLRTGARLADADITFSAVASVDAAGRTQDGVPVIDPVTDSLGNLDWATPTAACGRAMAAYLHAAIDDAMADRVAAIATGPINKQVLQMAGIHCNGHTEILARRTGASAYAMMLAGSRLRVVLATIHIPLNQVSRSLTTSGIESGYPDRSGAENPLRPAGTAYSRGWTQSPCRRNRTLWG